MHTLHLWGGRAGAAHSPACDCFRLSLFSLPAPEVHATGVWRLSPRAPRPPQPACFVDLSDRFDRPDDAGYRRYRIALSRRNRRGWYRAYRFFLRGQGRTHPTSMHIAHRCASRCGSARAHRAVNYFFKSVEPTLDMYRHDLSLHLMLRTFMPFEADHVVTSHMAASESHEGCRLLSPLFRRGLLARRAYSQADTHSDCLRSLPSAAFRTSGWP